MTCKAGHVLNYDGYCRICGEWLVDIDGPASPFRKRKEHPNTQRENDGPQDDHRNAEGDPSDAEGD